MSGWIPSANPLKRKHDVHVLLEHDTYVGMRKELFDANLTFPECIQEFAKMIGEKDPLAEKIIARCYKNKKKRELDQLRSARSSVDDTLHQLDEDALYSMIEEPEGPEEEERDDG